MCVCVCLCNRAFSEDILYIIYIIYIVYCSQLYIPMCGPYPHLFTAVHENLYVHRNYSTQPIIVVTTSDSPRIIYNTSKS